MKKKISLLVKRINKEIGVDALRIGLSEEDEIKFLPTGIQMFDLLTGGGFPIDRVTEIYGHEGSCKSTICQYALSQTLQNGQQGAWFDLEDALDPKFIRALGLDFSEAYIYDFQRIKPYGETVYETILKIIQAEVPLVIVDSVSALVSKGELEKEFEKTAVGKTAIMNNKGVKLITIQNRNTAVVLINQLRANMNAMSRGGRPAQDEPGGGKGIKFFSSLRVQFRIKEIINGSHVPSYLPIKVKDKKARYGQRVAFKIIKSKVGKAHIDNWFDFYDGYGVDFVDQRKRYLEATGKIVRKGNSYFYNKKKFVGELRIKEYLAKKLKVSRV